LAGKYDDQAVLAFVEADSEVTGGMRWMSHERLVYPERGWAAMS
jgi:hypothetical protein